MIDLLRSKLSVLFAFYHAFPTVNLIYKSRKVTRKQRMAGIVNLRCEGQSCAEWVAVLSGCRHRFPSFKRTCSQHPMMNCFESVPGQPEKIQNDAMHRKEELSLSWRLELSHLSFSLSGRLVGDFCSIVRVLFGVMIHRRHDRPERRAVTLQLVGDQAERNLSLPLKGLAKEPLRCMTVASRLDEDVDHVTVLIRGTPKIPPLTIDGHE